MNSRDQWIRYYKSSNPNFDPLKKQSYTLTHQEGISRFEMDFTDRKLTSHWESQVDFAAFHGFNKPKNSKLVYNSIVIDLLISAGGDKGVGYNRNNNKYKSFYTGILGRHTVINAIKHLVSMGFVYDFVIPKGSHNKQASFLYPTDSLHKQFGYVISQKLFSKIDTLDVITLKNRETNIYMPPPEERFIIDARAETEAQNAFLSKYKIDISKDNLERNGPIVTYDSDKGTNTRINLLNCSYKRKFLHCPKSKSNALGGRYYGAFWQNMSEKDRKKITINDEPVGQELDFSCLGLRIAYAKAGKRLGAVGGYKIEISKIGIGTQNTIPFLRPEQQRNIIKKVCHISINAETRKAVEEAIKKELKENYTSIFGQYKCSELLEYSGLILDAFLNRHQCIRQFLCSDFGVESQYIDSEIMTEIHRRCREQNIPVLSVHDSVLYPASNKDIVDNIRKEVLENYLSDLIRKHSLRTAS